MKFSCDNCGAQYLIADEKLGRRGVKVRCKKCAYVIIVRPPGFDASANRASEGAEAKKPSVNLPAFSPAPPSGDLNSGDLVQPGSGAAASGSPSGRSELELDAPASNSWGGPPVASAALPTTAPAGVEPARDYSAGLEINFDASSEGASTGDLDPKPPPAEPSAFSGDLGASIPSGYEANESTSIEAPLEERGRQPRGRRRMFGVKDETRVSVAPVAPSPASSFEIDVDVPADLRDAVDDSDEPTSLADRYQDEQSSEGREESEPLPEDAAPAVSSGDVRTAFAGIEKDELRDMRSSLEGELSALKDDAGLDAEASTDDAGSPAAAPKADGDDPAVAAQIGNAFAVMFGSDEEDTGAEPADQAFLARAGRETNGTTNGLGTHSDSAPADQDEAASSAEAADHSDSAEDDVEWYVAIDDEQVGPLSFDEVKVKWRTGAVGPTSLAWSHGMNDWTAIRLIPELAELHSPQAARSAPAPDEEPTAINPEADVPAPPEPEPEPIPLAAESIRRDPARYEPSAAASISPSVSPAVASAAYASSMTASASTEDADTGGWRPSAASALASLAAEEMAGPSAEPLAPITDIKAGPALPATTDALERLLEGDARPRATAFGAAEKSESRVRPLPRQPDTVSSVPLRDPVEAPRGQGLLGLIAAIVGGFAVLGVIVVGGMYLFIQPQSAAVRTGGSGPTLSGGSAGSSEALAGAVGTEPDAGANLAVPDAATASATPKPTPKPERVRPSQTRNAVKSTKTRVRPKPVRRRPPPKAPPPRAVVAVEPPPPPPPSRPARRPPPAELDEESLINPPGARRTPPRRAAPPPPSLPQGLDETDILDVLRKNRAAVRTCLSRHSASGSPVSGTMTVYMVVLNSGRPTRVSVSPEFRDTVAGSCIVNTVKRWRFPRFAGASVPVDFPVTVRGG